tara:strand:+ start:11118 stop:12239 length:1122 start_codon:yes stop_codon:yes gene_type:complete
MIGAAAARHLTLEGHEVTLIGPDEPTDPATHTGPFASHYDAGRITRQLDPWIFWSRVSRASIARYREIEATSGVRFFTEAGSLMAGPEGTPQMQRLDSTRLRDSVPCEVLRDAELAARFPYFDFHPGTVGFLERSNAGHINPRELVRAQITAATAQGATLLRDVVQGIDDTGAGVTLRLSDGTLHADRALIATGGFTRALTGDALPFQAFARTAVLFEVSQAEAERLAQMPTLIVLLPNGEDPYLLPPIRYPDGKMYLKMGGDTVDVALETPADFTDWYRSGGSARVGAQIEGFLRDRMPSLDIASVSTMPCVTTFTPDNIPHYKALSDNVFTAFAGCGRGAKNSDELGRLGALLATGRALPDWANTPAVAAE